VIIKKRMTRRNLSRLRCGICRSRPREDQNRAMRRPPRLATIGAIRRRSRPGPTN